MADFTARPLGILDNIYRFVGGLRGVNRVDLSSDITLVHDVSRQGERAGLGRAFGRIAWQETFSPNGTLEEIITRPVDVGPVLQREEHEYELWILSVEVNMSTADGADVTSISFIHGANSISQRYQQKIGSTQPIAQVIYFSDTPRSSSNSSGTAKASVGTILNPPVRTIPGGFIAIQAITTAATVMDFTFEMWAGPPGSTPPGVA